LTGAPVATDATYVQALYRTLLGREIDAIGVALIPQVARLGRQAVALVVLTPHVGDADRRAAGLSSYFPFLHRAARPLDREVNSWDTRADLTLSQIRSAFLASLEYYSNF